MTTATTLRSRLHRGAALTALVLAVGAAAPAFAQETGSVTLDDVIVTAQKRSENIQEVPVSVATMGGEKLDALFAGGEDVLALSSRVPGLFVESSNGRAAPRFYIRGLGNTDFDLAASQPVSVIMDDVVMENVVLKSTPIFDVDQVEVLRGPQGTLFGRNTTAGIVKFDSVKPSQTFKANGTVTYGTYGSWTAEGGVGGPLIEGKLAGRIAVLGQHRDNYIDNAFTHVKDAMGGYDEYAIRGQLLWTPTENLSVLLNAHNRTLDGTAAIFRANILTKGSNKINGNFDRDSVFYNGGANNPQKYDGNGESIKVDYDFGGVTLTSISAYETTNGYSRGDIDGGVAGVGPGFIPFDSDTRDGIDDLDQYTQEVRLASDTEGPFSWQFGGYYFKSDFLVTTDAGFNKATLNHKNTAWAGFGQVAYQVTPALKITGGARYTDDKKTMTVVGSTAPEVSVSDSKVSWDLSAFYDVTDDFSLYARAAHGFRGPTIQGRDIVFFSPASVAKSETIQSYEVGFKSELLDRRLRFNGAAFTYEEKDPQFSAIGGAGNNTLLINADKGQAYGVEFDGEFKVTENLLLTAGYSYNHTKIKDKDLAVAVCAQCTVTDPLNAKGQALVDGNPFPNAPKYVLNFTARYSYPIGDGELFAYTDWFKQGYTNIFLYQSKEFYSKGAFEGGLKLGYAKRDGAYEIAAFARNITNEVNLRGGIDFNNLTGFVNEPRIVGISISAKR
ncbi:TonB-dependent receptor [Caulobacter sp. UNC279MFTsu5.1]|uniref:TonB-dependent receptor n=1 Tax=Caulobacter sp. UNC279MFTsu5.1 TaxID=1502775 RepID=UPI0008E012C5|nr:TonB-dependent receptor [Caulobacter sp. UNC279MFTsu5.1]SFK25673.1 Outer membrane receptor proteins, mostly Fe transport [Caulobacter sp. UNC279MFTsu5.1]